MSKPAARSNAIEAIIERVQSVGYELRWIETAIISDALDEGTDTMTRHDLRHRCGQAFDALTLLEHSLRRYLAGQETQ